MKAIQILFGLVMIVALDGVAAWAQKVNVDWDKSANFHGYTTYAWTQGTPAKNQLMDQRIVAAVDRELAAKGLQKAAEGTSPSLLVAYNAAVTTETQLNTTNMGGYGWGYGWGGGTSTTTVQKIPVGELVVDIGDPNTKKMLWQGTATDTVNDNPEKTANKIDKAVGKMFKKFPPPVKEKD
jgi:hypothetical protein